MAIAPLPSLIEVDLPNGIACEVSADSALARTARRSVAKGEGGWIGPSARERNAILHRARSIAIVGMSADPSRASYFVGTYLSQAADYELYFVNPNATEILGRPVYASLAELPVVPDIVDVFRKPEAIPAVVDETVAIGLPVLWVQLGIWNEEAAKYGESKGLTVVMDRCIKVEHARFHGGLHLLGFDTGVISARRATR